MSSPSPAWIDLHRHENIRKTLLKAQHQQAYINSELNKKTTELTALEARIEDEMRASAILQAIAAQVQQVAHDRIASIVSYCLTAVFDEPYEFHIRFEKARNKTEARLVFVRDGEELDPLTSSGGGVVDVAAFALRLAGIVLSNPPVRKLMILDEPFKFVSKRYRHKLRDLLVSLARDMGVQFILSTHIPEICCGRTVDVGLPNSISPLDEDVGEPA